MSKGKKIVTMGAPQVPPQPEAIASSMPTKEQIAGGLDQTVLGLLMTFKKLGLTGLEIHAIARILTGLTLDGKQSQLEVSTLFETEAASLHESYKLNLLRASVDPSTAAS